MKVLHKASDLAQAGRKICAAIGVFDGVHLGHQQVIRQTVADAQQCEGVPVAITFERHPNVVVAPARVPPLIYSTAQKLRAIAGLGVETAWVIQFDEPFSRQTGEQFVRGLARDCGSLRSISVGSEFTFGFKRSGDVALLQKLGRELQFAVHGLAAVAVDGRAVSSTRIREAIAMGHFDAASQLLGRGYSIAGTVVKGEQLGRQLGFPTANLDVAGLALPPNGVYAAHATVEGFTLRAAVNIGVRPTVATGQPARRVEAHLLDWNGELYGQEIELAFVARLRDEQRFDSVDALRAQIGRDAAQARAMFNS